MNFKHYILNSERGQKDKKHRTYTAKCGEKNLSHSSFSKTLVKVTCPNCLLELMTDYEKKIATIEDRYVQLYPDRPVGEKLQ